MMEDDASSAWLHMDCRLVRIARTELDARAADPNRRMLAKGSNSSDCVMIRALLSIFSPLMTKSVDRKLCSRIRTVPRSSIRTSPVKRLSSLCACGARSPIKKTEDLATNANEYACLAPHVHDMEIDDTALIGSRGTLRGFQNRYIPL